MVEVLLVLEIFLTKDSLVEDLLCGAPSCAEVYGMEIISAEKTKLMTNNTCGINTKIKVN